MSLIRLQKINLAFGGPPLFETLNLQVDPGERIALLGRNGAGKTTLMQVMTGHVCVDSGEIFLQKGIQVASLPQEVPCDLSGTVFDIVLSGLGESARLIGRYHHLTHLLEIGSEPELLRQLNALQDQLDQSRAWDLEHQVSEVLTRMKLEPDSDFAALSGGQKRRALLARALVCKPDVLLLDEPTNHLDIESMLWLEGFLLNYPGTVFLITHDRMFMANVATRIVELDRGQLFSWACDYPTFLARKEALLESEQTRWEQFDKKLAKEEVWIRQGIKARRCRNEGRVKALERMRGEKQSQRKTQGQMRMQAQQSERSGRLVAKVRNMSFQYGARYLVRGFSADIMRGDKIGVIGPNGIGKTTLLRLLVGDLTPHTGRVKLGTNLSVSYYDQLRSALDENRTVAENLNATAETLMINGKPRHILGYLQDFLFTPDRACTPVKALSGGERNRLLLARLFSVPSNVLVMDEPTNDLDIETLELLEELLLEYPGTLLLVSHDRTFLNNVVTSTMVMEGDGVVKEYPGGYDDWLAQRQLSEPLPVPAKPTAVKKGTVWAPAKNGTARKLTFKEQRELESLPAGIEKLETEQQAVFAQLADSTLYRDASGDIAAAKARAAFLSAEIERAFARWHELDARSR